MDSEYNNERMAWPVELHRRRTASGWEWFMQIGGKPVYPNCVGVGVFTDGSVNPDEAFRRVIRAWREV